jgi:aspartyl-tRNA(Asn)/glutamyl-tRNA(Gln) amidotransferase subunit A
MTDNLYDLPLSEIAARLASDPGLARHLAEEAIARGEARPENGTGPYREWRPDIARAMADGAVAAMMAGTAGPLGGIPVSVKDLYGVAGTATYAGTPKQLPATFETEGWLVGLLRNQGAVFTGKTHTVEFAFGGLGVNGHWGSVRNPWDDREWRVSGGSSAGAGVSLTEGSALMALGTDTGGSVRIPAAMTGNVGLKTTIGRWPTNGVVPLSHTLDTVGILTRTVADAAFAFAAIEGTGPVEARPLAGLRIGRIGRLAFDDCSHGIVEAVDRALGELEAAGATLVDIEFPEAETAFDLLCNSGIPAMELRRFIDADLPEWLDSMDWPVKRRMVGTDTTKTDHYEASLTRLAEATAAANARFADIDLLACPTVPVTPPVVETVAEPETYAPQNLKSLRNTAIGNYLGLCGVTLPVGLDAAGMPVGLQLLQRGGGDREVLEMALPVEATLGTANERLGRAPGVVTPRR